MVDNQPFENAEFAHDLKFWYFQMKNISPEWIVEVNCTFVKSCLCGFGLYLCVGGNICQKKETEREKKPDLKNIKTNLVWLDTCKSPGTKIYNQDLLNLMFNLKSPRQKTCNQRPTNENKLLRFQQQCYPLWTF